MERLNLENKRFGKLLVVSLNRVENKRTFWNCICDCGNEKISDTWTLRAGRCKSCGCLLKIAHNKEDNRNLAMLKNLYNYSIVKRSKKLKLDYDININDFEKLINQPCYYCGLENSNEIHDFCYNGKKKYMVSDYSLKFNGIDRINNNLGYLKNNVVTCCKHCNSAKNSMNLDDFRNFIIRIYNHFINK